MSVSSWTVGQHNSKEALREVVLKVLADYGLTGTVEGPSS